MNRLGIHNFYRLSIIKRWIFCAIILHVHYKRIRKHSKQKENKPKWSKWLHFGIFMFSLSSLSLSLSFPSLLLSFLSPVLSTYITCVCVHVPINKGCQGPCRKQMAHCLFTMPRDYLQRWGEFRKTGKYHRAIVGSCSGKQVFTCRPWTQKANGWIASFLALWLSVQFHLWEAPVEAPRVWGEWGGGVILQAPSS